MLGEVRWLDVVVLVVYFASQVAMGPYFARRAKSTESYFVGNRNYPGWLLGVSMFGTSISSITFVGYPADGYKTAWLRFLICVTLPVAILIASIWILPFFRRTNMTSAFEYLESRFGPGTRMYAALMFLVSQSIRLSLILFLVSKLVNALTGWDTTTCILVGGVITSFYTVLGGIEAVIWTDFIQAIVLTFGGLLVLIAVLYNLPGGLTTIWEVAIRDNKFVLGDPLPGTSRPVPAPLIPQSFQDILSTKTVIMLILVGFLNWMTEYSSNQNVVQKYCAAKTIADARRAMWINCFCSLPTWAYFMFLGTALYVFYQVNPDPEAAKMLTGERKAEDILPYFVSTHLYQGLSGIVIAGVLAAAMSSLSSSINSMSAVSVVDIYKRHLKKGASDTHYVKVAKWLSLASSVIMIGGAYWLSSADTTTLQDTATKLNSISAGGLLGLFMLGFLTVRGDGRAVLVGILFTVLFSSAFSLYELGLFANIAPGLHAFLKANFDTYYVTVVGNIVMFVLGYIFGMLLPARKRDLKNLTVWTQDESMPAT
ncbi:MAG: sodium/solute symporter [Candidatus Hydrogenedentes bacterium]|nr:sodium/solute symporter [Candidatus Hydrogenedentota bacterium]